MKKIFHRQIKMLRLNDNEQSSINPNFILKDIQVGNTYALMETYQERKFLVQISQLTKKNFEIKTFVELDKKYNTKFTTLLGEYIYTVLDNKLLKLLISETAVLS